jgi:hypothetical protein
MAGQPLGQLSFSRVDGRTVASRVFATSPLKFMVPTKVGIPYRRDVWPNSSPFLQMGSWNWSIRTFESLGKSECWIFRVFGLIKYARRMIT